MTIRNSPDIVAPVALSFVLFTASMVWAAPDNQPQNKEQQAELESGRENVQRTAASEKGTTAKGSATKDKSADTSALDPRFTKLQDSVDTLAKTLATLDSSLSALRSELNAALSGNTKQADKAPTDQAALQPHLSPLAWGVLLLSLLVGPLISWLVTRRSLRGVGLI